MATWTDAELNRQADWLAGRVTAISFHTASPGGTGANESTIARVAPSWSAGGAAGSDVLQPALVGRAWSDVTLVDVPAGVAVSHVGLWAGVVFVGWQVLPSVVTGPVVGWRVATAVGPNA